MKKTVLLSLLLGLALLIPDGGTLFASTGAAWLEIGPGGRAAGLAEAITASVDGPTSTYWNPAAVGLTGGVELMHAEWIAGTVSQYVASDVKLGQWGLGFSALHVGTGDLELRDSPSTQPIGHFEARSYGVGLSVSRSLPLGGLRIGLTGRFLSDAIYVHSGDGWSVDAGLLYPGLFENRLDIATTVRHLGKMQALNEEAYDLPLTTSLGVLWHFNAIGYIQPDLMLDVVQVRDYDLSLRGAAEINLTKMFALRCGYATGYDTRGLSAGFGLHWKGWRFDYGYTPFSEDVGFAQRLSISMMW